MATDERLSPQRPWPGLASYGENVASFFLGRRRETDELFRRVQQETITLLFGKTGLGKSSLLKAGLFPLLRKNGYLPIYLRLDYSREARKVRDQLQQALLDACQSAGCSITLPDSVVVPWEIFHSNDFEIESKEGRSLCPVLVFDQFEELFISGGNGAFPLSETVVDTIESLAENRLPAVLKERFRDDPKRMETYDFDSGGCKMVLSLREDFLPLLERFRPRIPKIFYNRIRLEPLDGENAWDVILQPSADLVDEPTALVILNAVSSSKWEPGAQTPDKGALWRREVNPALLSLLCTELNERRIHTRGVSKITADLVQENRDRILQGFYERCYEGISFAVRRFVEDELVSASGPSGGFRKREELQAAISNANTTREVFDTLIERRLLTYEKSGEATWLELTHDILVEVVLSSRQERQTKERLEEARKKRLARRQKFVLGGIALTCLALACAAGIGLFKYRRLNAKLTKQQVQLYEQKKKAIDAATGISDYLDGLLAIALEYQYTSGANLISPLLKQSILKYVDSVDELIGSGKDASHARLKLQRCRVIVNLLAGDQRSALRECERSLPPAAIVEGQDLGLSASLFALRGDIFDQDAARIPEKETNKWNLFWDSAKKSYEEAAKLDRANEELHGLMEIRIAQVDESIARRSGPDRFLELNGKAVAELKNALERIDEFLSRNPEDLGALRAKATGENKMGNFLKDPYEKSYIDDTQGKKVIGEAITHYNASIEKRDAAIKLGEDFQADQAALGLAEANLAESYWSLAAIDKSDAVSEGQARKFLDARIETCINLMKVDPVNPFLRSLLRSGLLNKAKFLARVDRSIDATQEARDLLLFARNLSPETIRDENLEDWHKIIQDLGMTSQWDELTAARKYIRSFGPQE